MADEQAQAATASTGTTMPPPSSTGGDPSAPALPSLNPADSPYKPLDLPQRVPRQIGQSLSPEEPNQNLGAVSKGGAIAYMADKVLRGAVQGYDARQAQKATQFNKKMSALSVLQQQLGQQYKEAYEEVGSSKPGMTPQQILEDPKVKQLHNQLLAVHQTTLDAIGKYLPPLQTDQKTGKQKEKRNLLERMFGQEPDESLRAYAEAATKLGPTAFYQVATPQQLNAMYEQRQAGGYTGQATADKAKMTAEMNAIDANPNATRDQRDRAEQIRMFLNPSLGAKTFKRYRKNSETGIEEQYEVDAEGNEIANTRRPLSTAGLNPKVPAIGSFGDFMLAAYGPKPTPKQYVEGQKLWKQASAQGGTTVSTHTVLVTQGDKQVPFTFTNTSTKSPSGGGAAGASAPDVRADQPQGGAPAASTPVAPRTMVIPNPKGLVEPGNIPIDNRPTIYNEDGSHSSEYSVSFSDDKGHEVLVPTVVNGKFLTPDGKKPPEGSAAEKAMFKAAWNHYLQTGQHLGKFDNADDADAYANKLHSRGDAKAPNRLVHSAIPPRPATGSHAPVQSGEAIGYKDSPEYKGLVKQAIDTQKEYNGAYTNLSTMIKTAAAAKRGDGAAQVGIISAYLKTVVGGQGTGVRITKAEWDAATGTRPFLQGIKAKFSPDGYMSGAAIAPSQVDQMTREVLAKTQSLKETAKAAKQRMLDAQKEQVPENLRPKPAPSSHDEEIMNLLHPKQ